MNTGAICGGLTLLLVVVSGALILLGVVGLVLLRIGVIGAYFARGHEDRGESEQYALSQSRASGDCEKGDQPPADAG